MELTLPKAPQPSTSTNPSISRLLDLPPELRLQIYQLLLPRKVRVKPVGRFAWQVNSYRDALALLRTCHRIRDEARPLLFSSSAFHIELHDAVDARHFRRWVDGAGDALVARMNRVEIGVGAALAERPMAMVVVFVVVAIWAGEDGPVVTCSRCGKHVLDCPAMSALLRSERRTLATLLEGQRAVWRREWKGCFCVADLKMVVEAIYECVGGVERGARG